MRTQAKADIPVSNFDVSVRSLSTEKYAVISSGVKTGHGDGCTARDRAVIWNQLHQLWILVGQIS